MANLVRYPMHYARNSQIRNWGVVKHLEGHKSLPYELLWAYRGQDCVQVGWRFFPTKKAAEGFARDLEKVASGAADMNAAVMILLAWYEEA